MAIETHLEDMKDYVTRVHEAVPNRFKLAVGSAKRARQLLEGAVSFVEPTKPMMPVVTALREIASGHVEVIIRDLPEDDVDILERMDQTLDAEIEEELKTEKEDKKSSKDKDSRKRKSLAA